MPLLPGVKNFLAHVIVSVDEIENIMRSLDTHKAIGHDKLPTIVLKECAESLAPSITAIINFSLSLSVQCGIFPNIWKNGEVVPVHKKGIRPDCENYRPLTMLNLNSKILEDIVCDSLDSHLGANNLFHPNQWGLKNGVSTESLLLYLTETWKKAIDDGYKVGVLFVDFKKAFDTVDHTILKSKLSVLGVSGVFHEWIASYLHERSQYVKVNDAISKLRQIPIGVPQGSLLGPRLFSIYVYDLPNSSETGCIHMFADDTTIYYIGKEVEEIIDALNHILNDFREYGAATII